MATRLRESWTARLDTSAKKNLAYAGFLVDLPDAELAARRNRYIEVSPPSGR